MSPTDPPVTIPAIVYAAKSTKDTHGSIPTQLQQARAHAEAEGRAVLAEYADEDASAYSGNRGPQLAAAQAHAEALAAEHGSCELWCQHSDRLARGDGIKAKHLVEHELWAMKHAVRLRSVQDDRTFGDLLYAVVTGQRNNEDSQRKSAAIRDGLERAAQRGSWIQGGPPPDGYRRLPKVEGQPPQLVLDDERAPVIAKLFELGLAGMSSGEAARALNAAGLTRSDGKPWPPWRVRQSWRTPHYAGRLVFRGQHVGPGDWPALISGEDFDRLQRILATRTQKQADPKQRGGQRLMSDFLLVGLLRCGRCGGPVHALRTRRGARPKSKLRRYRCSAAKDAMGTCDAPLLSAAAIERPFVEHLSHLVIDLDGWTRQRQAAFAERLHVAQAAVERIEGEIADADRRLDLVAANYADQLAAGREDAMELALAAQRTVREQRARLQSELAELRAAVDADVPEPDPDAAEAFVTALRAALAGQVDGSSSVKEANARLREALDRVEVDARPDGSASLVAFVSEAFVMKLGGPSDLWPESLHLSTSAANTGKIPPVSKLRQRNPGSERSLARIIERLTEEDRDNSIVHGLPLPALVLPGVVREFVASANPRRLKEAA